MIRPARRRRRVVARPRLEGLESRQLLATFIVTNTEDDGPGTLRQAILDANANPGADVIAFDIPDDGPHTIRPTSALPTIFDPVTIDGTTQQGYAGRPVIELDGSEAGAFSSGLEINSSGNVVRGLAINRFGGNGIQLITFPRPDRPGPEPIADGNLIQANFIGTDLTGTVPLGNGRHGIFSFRSQANTIGGTTEEQRNLISGNAGDGIHLAGGFIPASTASFRGADFHQVSGNRIGTDLNGTQALGNGGDGVAIVSGSGNTIGGAAEGAGNLIAFHGGAGISELQGSADNVFLSNVIFANARPGVGDEPGGARVVDLRRLGFHAQPTRLILTFDQPLDPGRAENLQNYRLSQTALVQVVGRPEGFAEPLRSARYDPVANTVTLTPARPLPLRPFRFRLVADGTSPGGLRGLDGTPIDGNRDGVPGGDFVADFGGEILVLPPRLASAINRPDGRRGLPGPNVAGIQRFLL